MAPIFLFLFKATIPPVLVALVSLAARRWGAGVGGLLIGLPWMTGPILFFLGLDKGDAFALSACTGIEIGVACIACYVTAFGLMSLIARWPLCLAVATATFIAGAWVTREETLVALLPASLAQAVLPLSLTGAAGLAATMLVAALVILPRSRGGSVETQLPWWDIPVRMVATFTLVAIIMLTAEVLGPQLSGVVSTFPTIVTVVGCFTLHQWGGEAFRRMLRGLARSLFSFVAFFLVVGLALPHTGLILSFVLASLVALAMSALLLTRIRPRGA